LEGGDHAGLLALIAQVRAKAAKKLGAVPEVTSCYEAGYDGFWLHRLLEAGGIANYVFDAASIAVEQRRRRAKTDRIDGELLLRTLMAHLRGEPRVVRIVRVPSVAEEDARRWFVNSLPRWSRRKRHERSTFPRRWQSGRIICCGSSRLVRPSPRRW
jgi:transposase